MKNNRVVHPHGHGEREDLFQESPGLIGSSPRTWGTRPRTVCGEIPGRFIPTYMGNARSGRTHTGPPSVHPHVHGERMHPHVWQDNPTGSSPRTWGTRVRKILRLLLTRFIPTYMGNARRNGASNATLSVHPHVHGERRHDCLRIADNRGSSPRTWGTRSSSLS